MPETNDKQAITFFVNNQPVETTQKELSGLAIKQLAKVPADYELFRVAGAQTERIADNTVVHIHPKEQFRAIPAGTFGTHVITS